MRDNTITFFPIYAKRLCFLCLDLAAFFFLRFLLIWQYTNRTNYVKLLTKIAFKPYFFTTFRIKYLPLHAMYSDLPLIIV